MDNKKDNDFWNTDIDILVKNKLNEKFGEKNMNMAKSTIKKIGKGYGVFLFLPFIPFILGAFLIDKFFGIIFGQKDY